MPESTERRRDYRLRYPEALRPVLEVEQPLECASRYPVVDLSERGLRYLAAGDALDAGAVALPRLGARVVARLLPEEGEEPIAVAGRVVRVQDGEVALHLGATPIPLTAFLAEQRRVLRRARHAL